MSKTDPPRRASPAGDAFASPDDRGISRREFITVGTTAAAGLLLGCNTDDLALGVDGALPGSRDLAGAPDLASPPDLSPPPRPVMPPEMTPESGSFALGVASGDVTSEAAVVWTQYVGMAPLVLVVWQMDGQRYAVEREPVDARLAAAGFVHVTITGLLPGARYRYAFFEMEGDRRRARSAVGRFRAALAAGVSEVLTIGAVSCTSNGRRFDPLEHAGRRDDLDAFLLLGDTTYNDNARALLDYRARWAENLASGGYRSLRAATSVYATWDDHEVDNNWNPETINQGQLDDARRAFFENLPVRRDPMAPDRIWRRFTWGRTADLFVLDSRSERRPSTRRTQQPEYLSRVQMDWLKAGLAASTAAFKVIMNSVPISDFGVVFALGADDRWTGYGLQRTEVLEFIDKQGIKGVLWISGDFHLASMGRVNNQGAGSQQYEILVGPGGQTGNPLQLLLGNQKNIDWSSQTNNYTVLRLDPMAGEAKVSYIDGTGAAFAERTYRP